MNRAFSVVMFIFCAILAFNILNDLAYIQYQQVYDISSFNKTLGEVVSNSTGEYSLIPAEANNFVMLFGDFIRSVSFLAGVFLQSTVFFGKVLIDFGFHPYLANIVAIPYNLILIYGFIQFIANRPGQGTR